MARAHRLAHEGGAGAARPPIQPWLEVAAGYRLERVGPVTAGHRVAGRRVGALERGGVAIREDRLLIDTPDGALVLQFLSPGAALDEGAVPEVEAVIRSIRAR